MWVTFAAAGNEIFVFAAKTAVDGEMALRDALESANQAFIL